MLSRYGLRCSRARSCAIPLRKVHTDYGAKYAEKLRQRRRETGVSDDKPRATSQEKRTVPDRSPIRPLSSLINLPRILSSPHTTDQISALWTAYHAARSGGTGRGYLCASVPVDTYERMLGVARKYPSFLVPIPRGNNNNGYEFYFLQWGFHGPHVSTVLFTPLEEYKLRGAFATPHLVLTHYTELADTHGVVLLRGEITPEAEGQYMMEQEDAHAMAIGVQKFYLWGEKGSAEGERLLRMFHEKPDEFKWEEMLSI